MLTWKRERLTLWGGASYSRLWHQDTDFKSDDQDNMQYSLSANWELSKRLSLVYDYKRTKTDFVNQPESYKDWDLAESAGIKWQVLTTPQLSYQLAMQRTISQGEEIGWEPTHTFDLSEQIDLSKTLRLTLDAQYQYAQKTVENSIAFTYGVSLDNEVSRTVRQSLRASREPARTFGSTADTDTTSVHYSFQKQDLFIYSLTFNLDIDYSYNKPLGGEGEAETTWEYTPSLAWDRAVSRKIHRLLKYQYDYNTTSAESEAITEHRITLTYTYTF
jgi:hypothetical protein